MKIKFSEKLDEEVIEAGQPAGPAPAESTETEQALAVHEPSTGAALAVRSEYDDLEGELGADDLILARINVAQKVGELGERLGAGSIVLDKELVIWKEAQPPLPVIILSARKRYQENTEYGSDEFGQIVNTLDEVRNAGGSIEWRDGPDGRRVSPSWSPRLDIICAVQCPDGVDTSLFPFELGGKFYAPASWILGRSAYTSAGRTILTARTLSLKDGYRTGMWQVTAAKKQGPKGAYYVPNFRANGKTPEDLLKFLGDIYRG